MALDVIYVGNAIVDVVAVSDDSFLQEHNVDKGGMNLIDEERALYLSERLENPTKMAGGSAANSAVGMALLGGESGFVARLPKMSWGMNSSHPLKILAQPFLVR